MYNKETTRFLFVPELLLRTWNTPMWTKLIFFTGNVLHYYTPYTLILNITNRQNQLKVEIDFVGGLGLTSYNTKTPEPFYIVKDNRFLPVEGLYFHVS